MLIATTTFAGAQLIGWLIGTVIWLIMLIWTVSIARRKGRSAFGWGLFAFFFALFALIIVSLMPARPAFDASKG